MSVPRVRRRMAGRLLLSLTASGIIVILVAGLAQALPASTPQTSGMVNFPGAGGSANSVAVRTIAEAGSRIWVGGIFNEIDSSTGAKVADASGLAVFDPSSGLVPSGVHIPIATSTSGDAIVYDMSLGPDGNLYFVGIFDHVDGVVRNNVAAINPSTGALLPFAPSAARAYAVLATSTAVYVGTGKLLSFLPNGAATPGWAPPTVIVNASLRAHSTPAQFRDITQQGGILVATCQCDSLQDANGTRTVKVVVEIDAASGSWVNWRPANLPDSSAAFGITAFVHNYPGTSNPTVYLAAGGSDFTAAYDFSSGVQRFKTDTSGSSQTIVWYQDMLVVGGHFEWTQSPNAAACGSNAAPNIDCYFTPKLVAMDASNGKVVLDGSSPWNPGICCKYNGVWALLVDGDGSTLHVGGEFTWAGGTWICNTFAAACLTGKSKHQFYTRFGGPPAGTQNLTVNKVGSGGGTVTSNPPGIACGTSCSANFSSGTTLTLSASAAPGSTFAGWSGAGCSGTGACAVTLAQSQTVSATFTQPTAALTVQKAGTSSGTVTSSPIGINCGSACQYDYPLNQMVTLTAATSGATLFSGWSGGGCSSTALTCQVTMSVAQTVTATFGTGYKVTVNPAGTGSGTVTSSPPGISCGWYGSAISGTCAANFTAGSSPVLDAVADPGSSFTGWTNNGACSGSGTCTFTNLTSNKKVTSTFMSNQALATLAVQTDGAGQGTVTSAPAGISCPATCSASFPSGTLAVLSATPTGFSTFIGWGGACTGTGTCEVTMDAVKSVDATFAGGSSTAIEETDPAVAFHGWRGVADVSASGGSYRVSEVKNDKATWQSPTTTSLTWVTRMGPDLGIATVLIDGTNAGTVDLLSPSAQSFSKTYAGLSGTTHTVLVKATGTKNPSSSGTGVVVDAFIAGSNTDEESAIAVTYDAWTGASSVKASGGTYRWANASTATATVTFNGTAIDWITTLGPAYGKASVSIDGVDQGTVDLYAASVKWQQTLSYGALSSGSHTMMIRVLGEKNVASSSTKVAVDAFNPHP